VLAHENTKTPMAEPHDSAVLGLHVSGIAARGVQIGVIVRVVEMRQTQPYLVESVHSYV
jgi:hypothetical protein